MQQGGYASLNVMKGKIDASLARLRAIGSAAYSSGHLRVGGKPVN